jgi:hypothetical protein
VSVTPPIPPSVTDEGCAPGPVTDGEAGPGRLPDAACRRGSWDTRTNSGGDSWERQSNAAFILAAAERLFRLGLRRRAQTGRRSEFPSIGERSASTFGPRHVKLRVPQSLDIWHEAKRSPSLDRSQPRSSHKRFSFRDALPPLPGPWRRKANPGRGAIAGLMRLATASGSGF